MKPRLALDRKWFCKACAVAVCLAMLGLGVGLAAASPPLPRPRPAQAPQLQPPISAVPTEPSGAATAQPPEEQQRGAPEAPPAPSACRLALTEAIAIAPSIPPINGPDRCGGDDLVRLEAVVISATRRVTVKPPAILRCTMASAIADWVRTDLVPLASELGSPLSELDNFDSFECRGRNRVRGARLSEHGLANALDVRGLKLDSGATVSLTDRTVSRDLREKVRGTACGRFSTVLGPGSDWYHEDHVHLDLAERRNNYKICQWNIYDPLPESPPMMPAARPEEAPQAEDAKKG